MKQDADTVSTEELLNAFRNLPSLYKAFRPTGAGCLTGALCWTPGRRSASISQLTGRVPVRENVGTFYDIPNPTPSASTDTH